MQAFLKKMEEGILEDVVSRREYKDIQAVIPEGMEDGCC